jgi:hypothetical protein
MLTWKFILAVLPFLPQGLLELPIPPSGGKLHLGYADLTSGHLTGKTVRINPMLTFHVYWQMPVGNCSW